MQYNLHVFRLYVNGITPYVFFCYLLSLLNIMFLRFMIVIDVDLVQSLPSPEAIALNECFKFIHSFFRWCSFSPTRLQPTLMEMPPTACAGFSGMHPWGWNDCIHKVRPMSALLSVSKLSLHDCASETLYHCVMVPLAPHSRRYLLLSDFLNFVSLMCQLHLPITSVCICRCNPSFAPSRWLEGGCDEEREHHVGSWERCVY